MSRNKDSRKAITQDVRLQLWIRAGGRCQLKHCNKPVYQHGMTLADGNFADVAHIIGASKDGPRGNSDSKHLQTDISNLMLLCKECHKLIDSYEQRYDTDLLRQWKREHEERIEILTGISPQIPRSTVLKFQINIGDRVIGIRDEAMYNAMFNQDPPKYPIDKKGISIVEKQFDLYGDKTYWTKFAQDHIANKLLFYLDTGIGEHPIQHLSVFAIGPMPLLMYLGKCIGDTIHADIYHANRRISDTNATWSWPLHPSDAFPEFRIQTIIDRPTAKMIAIILELSDRIASDKYENFVGEDFAVYSLSVDSPSPHLIESPAQLECFSRIYRRLLNQIQTTHGVDCCIFLLPAIPAAIAVECGRVLLPTKDPGIIACQMQLDRSFKPVLRIV